MKESKFEISKVYTFTRRNMSIRKSEFSLLQRLNTFASLTFMRKIKTRGATKSQSRLETSQIFELPLLFSLEWWVKERKKGDVGGG